MSASKNVKFAEKLHNMEMKYAPDQINMANANQRTPADLAAAEIRQPGVMDEQFPTDALTQYDERDRVQNAKLQLGEGMPMGYTPFGKMEAKDSDFDWYQKKQAAVELANFQRWFAKEFDLMSPVQKKRAKELYPEFYAQRKRLLRKQAKNLFDLARIKLEGIDKFKDLVKVYMAETGRLDVGPLKTLLNPEMVNLGDDAQLKNKAAFQRGLANPFLVFGKEVIGNQGRTNVKTRQEESQAWERRRADANWDHTTRSGVDNTDFPPFQGRRLNQSDQQWFQVLRQGMSTI
jgi:hypothetical protein